MAQYLYSGRSARGELVRGTFEGDSEEAVAARLQQDGVTPIDIAASADAGTAAPVSLQQLARRLGWGKPRTADLVLFTRQMYTIVKSGIPLLRGLRGLAGSTHNTVLRRALEDILRSLEAGRDLATSFGRHPDLFPEIYLNIIAVGEATGTLEPAFMRLGEYLRQEQDLQDRVKSALRYPLIVVLTIAVAIGVITTFVIPRFAPLFRVLGNDIPLPTRIIMGASDIARRDWYWVLAVGAALIGAVRAYVRTPGGRLRWHRLLLALPVIGPLAHQAILAREQPRGRDDRRPRADEGHAGGPPPADDHAAGGGALGAPGDPRTLEPHALDRHHGGHADAADTGDHCAGLRQ